MMAEWFGYTALGLSLVSMNMTDMRLFRWLHLLASCVYMVYGLMISAMPLIIGATLFVIIHCYRLYRLYNPDSINRLT